MLLNPYRFGLPPSPFLTSLVSYWKLDEVSGNAIDIHGTNPLTDIAPAVGTGAGLIGTARLFNTSGGHLARASADLTTGDIDFTISCWCFPTSASQSCVLSKWASTGGANEFRVYHWHSVEGTVWKVTGPSGTVDARAGNMAANIWHHIIVWHDATANQIGISLDGGAPVLTSFTGGPNANAAQPFRIGAAPGLEVPWNGRIDEVGFWRRMLTTQERADLYNGGSGWPYPLAPFPTVAAFSGAPRFGAPPFSVTFTDQSSRSPTSWAWEKNNGSGWVPFAGTPTAQNPVEVFAAGTWSVRLTATNAGGSDDEEKTNYVSDVNPWLTGLVSYWKMDEASGNAIDAHGTNHLTDNNTVTSAAGKIGNARDFEKDNSESLSIASNATLRMGDIEFTITAWVKWETTGGVQVVLGKDDESPNREYTLYSNAGVVTALIAPTGAAGSAVNLTGPTASAGLWYFIVYWHDPVANKIYLQVNNGTIYELAVSGGAFAGTAPFIIGGLGGPLRYQFDGLVDEVGIWKRMLTPAERTELWNSGNGKTYPFT